MAVTPDVRLLSLKHGHDVLRLLLPSYALSPPQALETASEDSATSQYNGTHHSSPSTAICWYKVDAQYLYRSNYGEGFHPGRAFLHGIECQGNSGALLFIDEINRIIRGDERDTAVVVVILIFARE